MGGVAQISEFGKILLFLIVGILLVSLIFFINRIASPKNPNPEKLTSYECGEEPTGGAWIPFNPRFYVIALIFLLFEVEMVFVFPWATVFGSHDINSFDHRWGILSLIEMFVFLGILILGLIYVWVKGDLEWIKTAPVHPKTNVKVPASLYAQLNAEQSNYNVKEFSLTTSTLEKATLTAPATATATTSEQQPIRKPLFKPTFKKPENE